MFLCFDVETNDMPSFKLAADHPDQARVVQIGAVLTDADLNPLAQISRIIKPTGWRIAEGAFNAHGISLERCMDEGIPIEAVISEFDAMADQVAKAEGTLVAYNIRFDNKLVRGERRRAGREDRFGSVREFDAMKAASPFCRLPPTPAMVRAGRSNQFKTPKLGEAHLVLCESEMTGAHDALSDVMATLAIVRCLRDKFGVDIRGEVPASYVPADQRPQYEKPAPIPTGPITSSDIF